MKTERQPRTAKVSPETQEFLSEKIMDCLLKFGEVTKDWEQGYKEAGKPLVFCFKTIMQVVRKKPVQRNTIVHLLRCFGVDFIVLQGGIYKHVDNGEK